MTKNTAKKKSEDKKMVIFVTAYKSKMGGIKDLLLGLGKKEVIEIDKEYQWRKLFGPWGLEELAKLYQGIKEDKLKKLTSDYHQEFLLKGLRETVFALKDKGFIVGVINSCPQFMVNNLKEILPFDFAIGTQLEFKGGVTTGKILKKITRYEEKEILKQKRKEYGINPENVITVGRGSITHLPIAEESGTFIGFDPVKNTISDIARIIIKNR